MSDAQLGPDEDSELRRLHVLKGFGMVAGSVTSRYEALRGRDRRHGVRNPDEASVVTPVGPEWNTGKAQSDAPAVKPAAQTPTLGEERLITDPREIFGDRPEPRRGRGIFRR